ncbi:DUF3025 domain-containing protein [Arenimonas sp.]|uniref:DUF3025 domain-containing protein n=1 Tax=Arenimonas sp. TaxID=1872635 RepID=UPI0039E4D7B3
MRFQSPRRSEVSPETFVHPIFSGFDAPEGWLASGAWPDVHAAVAPRHGITGRSLRFADPDRLPEDGLHYEARIHDEAAIPTRSENWHDLFNALVWRRFPAIKSALNRRQYEDLAQVGPHRRTPAQQAMTHYDEAGAIVRLRDAALLEAWDRHDWTTLFFERAEAWRRGDIDLWIFGHALLDHALAPGLYPVAKALVFFDDGCASHDFDVDGRVASAIMAGECLNDPQELRPLPLSGIPGWHRDLQDSAFYRERPCFRPLRAGRTYPSPLSPQDRRGAAR